MKKVIILFGMIVLVSNAALAQGSRSEVKGVIERGGPTVSLVSIAIENFRSSGTFSTYEDSILAYDMKQVLRNDLQFSLLFNVVEPDSGFLTDFAKGKMNLDDWIYLGAQMLISGRIEREANGFLFTADVTDIYRNKSIYSHDYVGESANYRYVMHKVAADLLLQLTGEEGCYFSKIVYTSDVSGHSELYVCDFDGFAPRQVTHENSIAIIPNWTPDGKQIYYTSFKKGNSDLYAYDLALNQSKMVSARTGLNTGGVTSPDGKYLVATFSMGEDAELYLIEPSGKIQKRLTFSKMIDTAPCWSPYSNEIAFTSDRTGQPQIYITDIEGLNTRRLTFQGDYNDQASWSPRGDLIAYASRERDGFQIYVTDVTGTSPQRLTDIGSNESPSWSPDGFHIVYTSNYTGDPRLMIMDFNGLDKHQLDIPGPCKTPEWSKNIK
jgi:TolB protein